MKQSQKQTKNNFLRLTVYAVLIAIAAAASWWFYTNKISNVEPNQSPMSMRARFAGGMGAIPVSGAVADLRDIETNQHYIGTVQAFNTATVRSKVDGELLELLFTEGGNVNQGDVLALIDPSSYQVQFDQAQGQLLQTQAQLNNAQQDLNRYQKLFKQQSISKQQLDNQLALVQQLQANLKSNQASLDNAQLQLDYTNVTAPISGRLGLRKVDIGNIVNASNVDGIVTITQVQPISVIFSIPQTDLAAVQTSFLQTPNLEVKIIGTDGATVIDSGVLQAIDNQIEQTTGTVMLKAIVQNDDLSLFPNQFVNVSLNLGQENILSIPVKAVQYGSVGTFVYVIKEDSTVKIQAVQLGQQDGEYVAIYAGLQQGDTVVTSGIDRLRESSKVELIPAEKDN